MAPVEPAAGGEGAIRVTLMRSSSPRSIDELTLWLPAGATVADALDRAGWAPGPVGADQAPLAGVWGRLQPLGHVLRHGDRVEVYRGLRVDPKEARRQRYAGHKAKSAQAKAKPPAPVPGR